MSERRPTWDGFVAGRAAEEAQSSFERLCAHVYQVLTKRAVRLRKFTQKLPPEVAQTRHIWLGVSVEDRKYGLPRIRELQEAQAAIRFLSIEPLLEDLGRIELDGIDWVIVGGESGPGARPMAEEWVVSIREQCAEAGVPFFFKQWGGIRKKLAGRELQGRTYDAVPFRAQDLEVPQRPERARRVDLARAIAAELR